MTVLADIERNKVALNTLSTTCGTSSFKVLSGIFGVDFTKPFALKPLVATNLRGFWSYANKKLSDNFLNVLIAGSTLDNLKAIAFNIGDKTFNQDKSYRAELSDVRTMLQESTKFVLSVAKNSLLYDDFCIVRKPTAPTDITLFTNSKYLSNQVRVDNVGRVLNLFKEQYKNTFFDKESTLPKVMVSVRVASGSSTVDNTSESPRPISNPSIQAVFDEIMTDNTPITNSTEQNKELVFTFANEETLVFSENTNTSEIFGSILNTLNININNEDENYIEEDINEPLFMLINGYKSMKVYSMYGLENLYTILDETQGYSIRLDNMFFKGMKPLKHSTNFASSKLFNPNLVDIKDNLPLDKSGYNRYLYRRQLHRRLIEYKNDVVFSDYDNYKEVKEFKNAETDCKETFLKVIRSRSMAKLSHKRIRNVNLLTDITVKYATIMQQLQTHYIELRLYRMNNSSETYTSLDDVITAVIELTKTLNKFSKEFKKFQV